MSNMGTKYYLGSVKRKSAFKHAQNEQIKIILHMRNLPSGPVPLHSYIL